MTACTATPKPTPMRCSRGRSGPSRSAMVHRQGGVRGGARARGVGRSALRPRHRVVVARRDRASLRHWERAYAAFRRRPDPEQAVLAAFYLCLAYRMSSQPRRLARMAGPRREPGRRVRARPHGRLGPGRSCLRRHGHGTAPAGERYARRRGNRPRSRRRRLGAVRDERARRRARRDGTGRGGRPLLDEAMAGRARRRGPRPRYGGTDQLPDDHLLQSRRRPARAAQWVRAADAFHRRYGSPHLYTTCRTHYGSVLFATGRWEEAEEELQAALTIGTGRSRRCMPRRSQARELRLARGRTEEAARLLAGYQDHPATGLCGRRRPARPGRGAVAS